MNSLTLRAVCQDQLGIIASLSSVLADCKINIEETNMQTVGGYFILYMQLLSPLNALKLEELLYELEQEVGLLEFEILDGYQNLDKVKPNYQISAYAQDQNGLVASLTLMLANFGIDISAFTSKIIASNSTYKIDLLCYIPLDELKELTESLKTLKQHKGLEIDLIKL